MALMQWLALAGLPGRRRKIELPPGVRAGVEKKALEQLLRPRRPALEEQREPRALPPGFSEKARFVFGLAKTPLSPVALAQRKRLMLGALKRYFSQGRP